jgi:hypothetical protein
MLFDPLKKKNQVFSFKESVSVGWMAPNRDLSLLGPRLKCILGHTEQLRCVGRFQVLPQVHHAQTSMSEAPRKPATPFRNCSEYMIR